MRVPCKIFFIVAVGIILCHISLINSAFIVESPDVGSVLASNKEDVSSCWNSFQFHCIAYIAILSEMLRCVQDGEKGMFAFLQQQGSSHALDPCIFHCSRVHYMRQHHSIKFIGRRALYQELRLKRRLWREPAFCNVGSGRRPEPAFRNAGSSQSLHLRHSDWALIKNYPLFERSFAIIPPPIGRGAVLWCVQPWFFATSQVLEPGPFPILRLAGKMNF